MSLLIAFTLLRKSKEWWKKVKLKEERQGTREKKQIPMGGCKDKWNLSFYFVSFKYAKVIKKLQFLLDG